MKKSLFIITSAVLAAASVSISAKKKSPVHQPSPASVSEIAARLDSIGRYDGRARFTVSMPQMSDDVVYDILLIQQASDSDRLATAPYLIDWTMTSHDARPHGFSAYYSGNHFRFSGERLQEYHFDWDSIPFRPSLIGSRGEGVHRAAQFFNLLPQGIATELRRLASDPGCRIEFHRDTLIGGRRAVAFKAVSRTAGVVGTEAEYIFDPTTSLPRRIAIENNPGQISEQSVYVDFADIITADSDLEPITEKWLAARYPEQFERFRESNFSIENLPGQRLPGFALPTSTGERYARRTGDAFRAPTIVVLLDAGTGFTSDVVAAVRQAVDRLPADADVIWAFTDNVTDRVEPLVGELRPGEHLLISARALARDCGAASLPALLLVDRQGTVGNVILGYNKDLVSDVIQKMALVR